MNRVMLSVGGLLIALVILVALNVVAGFGLRGVRADMTEHKLYTLSDASKKVLGAIDERITLRFFRSRNLSEKYLAGFAQRVEELLIEYAERSGGKLTLEVRDPEPFSETEELAASSGVQGIPLPGGEALYFGVAGSNSFGDEQVIPFVDPSKEEFLEYDLTKLVYSLAHPSKLVVGVLSTLPIEGAMANPFMQQNAPQPWFLMDQIRQLNYETRTIQPNASEIPVEVNVLLVVHPKNLPDSTQYAIDQFVLRGGQALVFADPFCDADTSGEDPSNPMSRFQAQKGSGLPRLFDAWGLTMVPDKIVGDRKLAIPARFNNRGREDVGPYVAWLGLGTDNVNQDEVVTSQLQRLRMSTAGILEAKSGATTQFVPLIQTSEDSMEIATSQIQFAPDIPKLLADFFPSGKKTVVAARVTGPAKTAFEGGKPAAPPDPENPEAPTPESGPHLTESAGSINVIVVADADMLADHFWVQVMNFAGMRMGSKTADNGDFVINALDFLHGSTDLVSLRARGSSSYPFLVVQEMQRQADQKFREEEQRLNEELDKAERKISELQSQKEGANAMLLSPEQVQELERLRDERIKTKRRLREIKFDSNKEIAWTGTKAKLLNILLMPVLVLLAAVAVFVYREMHRKAA